MTGRAHAIIFSMVKRYRPQISRTLWAVLAAAALIRAPAASGGRNRGRGPRGRAQGRAQAVPVQRQAAARRIQGGAGTDSGGTKGARARLPDPRGPLLPGAPQYAQRFLSVHPGVLPEQGGRAARAQEALAARRLDHDPRPAECPEASVAVLFVERLDRRLHRPVQLRHGRSVDAHPRQHSDRHLSRNSRRHVETTILSSDMVDARVAPKGSLEHLSQQEIAKLLDSGQGGLYPLFRKCALAVLNSGSDIDDPRADLREIPGLRPAHRAPGLGHQARDQERAGVRLRRRAR